MDGAHLVVLELSKGDELFVEGVIEGRLAEEGEELVGEVNVVVPNLEGKPGKELAVALELERLYEGGIWTDDMKLGQFEEILGKTAAGEPLI